MTQIKVQTFSYSGSKLLKNISNTEVFFAQPKENVIAMLTTANEARQKYYETG